MNVKNAAINIDDPSKKCKGCGSRAWALKSAVEKPRRR